MTRDMIRRITEQFGGQVSVLYHDNYYKAHHDLSLEERSRLNYDHPEAFDRQLFLEHLAALKNGLPVECPVYDYTVHNRSDKTVKVAPAPVIIVEGILILQDPDICDLLDIKLFVDTDADVRILRRILRDVRERGRTLESVVDQYLTTVKPMHELFVEPSRKQADLIVPEGGHNKVALDMILQRIRAHLTAEQL